MLCCSEKWRKKKKKKDREEEEVHSSGVIHSTMDTASKSIFFDDAKYVDVTHHICSHVNVVFPHS